MGGPRRTKGLSAITPVRGARDPVADGTVRDVEVHMSTCEGRGLVLFNDLTERSNAPSSACARARKRYRLIVENQTEFIVKWRPDHTRDLRQ
jgi:hypothetical protein